MSPDGELVRRLDAFAVDFLRVMEGRDLSREEVAFYQTHPKEWHWRKFHVLMVAASELRKMHGVIIELAFSHATIIPARELSRILRSLIHLKPLLREAVDCWEIDRDLAYERFGGRFAFSLPRPRLAESRR